MSKVVSNIKPLEFESVSEVPKTHTWSNPNDYPVSSEPVPVINLNDPHVLDHLSDAAKSVGAFQIVEHGVPLDFLQRFEHQMSRLFSLPMEQKMKAARTETDINGYGVVSISKYFSDSMWSEGIMFVGDPLEHAKKLWPEDPMTFCNVMEEYDKKMRTVACNMVKLLLQSLGLNEDEINSDNIGISGPKDLYGTVRFNHYPPCPEPDRAMGMGEHTDGGLITILYQSSVSGFQALKSADGPKPAQWTTFPATNGSLIVILGDLFQILTNGLFKSAYHRAVVNGSHSRLTSAFFCVPFKLEVSPIDKLVDKKIGSKYRSVNWNEYISTKGKHFQESLDFVKI